MSVGRYRERAFTHLLPGAFMDARPVYTERAFFVSRPGAGRGAVAEGVEKVTLTAHMLIKGKAPALLCGSLCLYDRVGRAIRGPNRRRVSIRIP